MRKVLITLLLSLFLGTYILAQQSAQAQFDEANTLFENGELREAMTSYRSIAASGDASGALFLNMGITAVQLDSMGLAKYYFLRARDFETTQDQAQTALNYVNSQFSRQSAKLPKLPWDRAVEWINESLTASALFIVGFLVALCGLTILFAVWFNKLSIHNASNYIITLLIVGLSLAGLAFYADYVNQRYDEAVLITNSDRVLKSPKTEAILESIAYEGYDLTIDHWKSKTQPNWLYVRLGNGQYGWIKSQGVKVL